MTPSLKLLPLILLGTANLVVAQVRGSVAVCSWGAHQQEC